uniref:Uncharacterized protein n=1 Tax=Magallana gigas TaxID=29159 RepID=K1QIZ0_MAGGI
MMIPCTGYLTNRAPNKTSPRASILLVLEKLPNHEKIATKELFWYSVVSERRASSARTKPELPNLKKCYSS